jgi:hypothetical protein
MPSPQHFHPEFGYLCPSPRVRGAFRVACWAGGIGILFGAVATLALVPRGDPDAGRAAAALAAIAAQVPAADGTARSAQVAAPVPEKSARARARQLELSGIRAKSAPCKQAASADDSDCLWRSVQMPPLPAIAVETPADTPPHAAGAKKKRPKAAQARRRAPETERYDPRSAYASPFGYPDSNNRYRDSDRRDWSGNGWRW